jgi:deazaflavin-dependent oxidoreductase (nitroreductase family)
MLPLAGWAPGFAIIHHVGRNSGRRYQTPVNVFRHGDSYVIPLTYGEGEWVKNVIAAGGCSIRTRGREVALAFPRLFRDPQRDAVPSPVGAILGVVDVDEFLALKTT